MKAAIFDMDGTLINSLIFWNYLWETLGRTFKNDPDFRPDATTDKECRTITLAQAMELVHERFQMGESGQALTEFTGELLKTFYRDVVEPKPGAVEFLQHLQSQGVKMAVATASDGELVTVAMERCGITSYIDAVYSCATVGKGKEHPDVFLMALDHLGTTAEETWMFEDSYVALQTAKKIGMPTVGIYDPHNYGQDRIKAIATEYIAPGETLLKLV